MSDTAILAEGLSKKYTLGRKRGGGDYERFSEMLMRMAKAPFRAVTDNAPGKESDEDFWALDDVSFELKQGERLGVIGRNGAGKSTLLKILSRITEPTRGRAVINGRVASLLEVGAGFHPELTGRENIFLNGSVLGMTREEIKRNFDEIVAFAEVERFLDTPVKRYSSGMYVRLAFAVAAHLEPEIMIVDEVLAVGDIKFQQKCLGKMESVANEGRTVLFVSHHMNSIEKLCDRAIILQEGKSVYDGNAQDAVSKYMETAAAIQPGNLGDLRDREGSGRARIVSFELRDSSGKPTPCLKAGEDCSLAFQYTMADPDLRLEDSVASIAFSDPRKGAVMLLRSSFDGQSLTLNSGGGCVVCSLKDLNLAEGRYLVTLFLSWRDTEILDSVSNALIARVEAGDYYGTHSKGSPTVCKMLTRADWRVE